MIFLHFLLPSSESGAASGFGGLQNGAKQPRDQKEVAEMYQYPGAGLAQTASGVGQMSLRGRWGGPGGPFRCSEAACIQLIVQAVPGSEPALGACLKSYLVAKEWGIRRWFEGQAVELSRLSNSCIRGTGDSPLEHSEGGSRSYTVSDCGRICQHPGRATDLSLMSL